MSKKTDKKFYIDPEKLKQEVMRQQQGNPSDELGRMMLLLCDKILSHQNFKGYPEVVKDEMKSLALFWMVRGLKNIKPDRPPRLVFNYLTTAVFTAYYATLKKYYKQLKLKDKLIKTAMAEMQDKYGIQIKPEIANTEYTYDQE